MVTAIKKSLAEKPAAAVKPAAKTAAKPVAKSVAKSAAKPTAKKAAAKPRKTAEAKPVPAIKTVLAPGAAWPFPTGPRPS